MSYGKVHQAYWESETIAALSDDAALLGLFLISGPHRNAIGCFKLGLGAITDHPRFGAWGFERASKALTELVRSGFIARDEKTGWILIRNALKHDPVTSRNTAVGAAKLANLVPENIDLYQELVDRLSPQLEEILKSEKKAPGYPMRPPSKPLSSRFEAPSKPLRTPEPEPEPTPEPQQQPAAAQGGSNEFHPRYPEVRARVEKLLDSPSLLVFGRVNAWLQQGADPETEIYPILEARKANWRGRKLEYFDDAIADAIASRSKPMPPGAASKPGAVLRMASRFEARDALRAVGLYDEPARKEDFADWRQRRETHLRGLGIDPRSLTQ